MTLTQIAARNIWRNKSRTLMTVLGGAVAVVAFVMLRTVLTAWSVGADYAAQDRIGTRHKVSFIIDLPYNYIETIRQIPGVKTATFAKWFGARNPKNLDDFFASFAVDSKTYFDVYDELSVPKDQMERWLTDRQGAIIGDQLARKMGLSIGDRVTLTGTIYPGDWQFVVDGIYQGTRPSADRSQFIFHYAYVNETVPQQRRDQIGWVVSRIVDSSQSAQISAAIDRVFDEKDTQTTSMSERAMNLSFISSASALLTALNVVSGIIMLIMMMILGNTIAMGVRERTREYGVLRAVGFLPKHVRIFVLGEALTTALLAGVTGLLLSYPIVQMGMGRWLEENMGGFFPYFRIEPSTAGLALTLSVALGLLAALLPARHAGQLSVTDALRRVG